MSEHCKQFSKYDVSVCLLGASSASIYQEELSDMERQNNTNNTHKPKNQRIGYSVELMTPTKSSEKRKTTFDKSRSTRGG